MLMIILLGKSSIEDQLLALQTADDDITIKYCVHEETVGAIYFARQSAIKKLKPYASFLMMDGTYKVTKYKKC